MRSPTHRKAKDLASIETEINRWEEKVAILQTQFGEELSSKMNIAVLTNKMPVNIHEHSTVEDTTLYNTVKEKVRAMVQNKIAANMGPAPMDIGDVAMKSTTRSTVWTRWIRTRSATGVKGLGIWPRTAAPRSTRARARAREAT